ncbi:MAG: site-specific DNA-methyltransferase [Planctomycetes bacterium]|nr:site-specific DNA-methyltransferase [Planctomycetota bacterium]
MPNHPNTSFLTPLSRFDGAPDAIVRADCQQMLPLVPTGSVALTHTSPPYNIGRRYHGFRDSQEIEHYSNLIENVARELFRVTRPGGSLFWQVGYTDFGGNANGESSGIKVLDALSLPIFETMGFHLWDRIIWNYFGSMAFKSKFTNRHETILWLLKPNETGSTRPVFHLDEIRERSKEYDGRNHLFGRNPGNVWQAERVAFGSVGQTSHIAVFPEEVSEKIVRACSQPGDVILDPFSGSGTLPKVAYTLDRRFLACEISEKYARQSDSRLRMWGSSHAENLAIGLLVQYAFHGRKGSKPIRYLADVLQGYAAKDDLPRDHAALEEAARVILGAERVTKVIKLQKQKLWVKYDRIIADRKVIDELSAADRGLAFCYGHRKRWNGVRRYLTAGRALIDLRTAIDDAGGTSRFVRSICRKANARFLIDGQQVRCLRTDPGLGCNGAPEVTRQPNQQMTFS